MPNFVTTVSSNPITSTGGSAVLKAEIDITEAIPRGNYTFQWACEIRLQSVVAGAYAQADLLFNGSTAYQDSHDNDQWHLFAGAGGAFFDGSPGPNFQLVLSRQGAIAVAEIRRARMTFIQETT